MSVSTAVSTFAVGGSSVICAAREVALGESVERAFQGCRSLLAVSALAVAREDSAEDRAAKHFNGCHSSLAVAALAVAHGEEEASPPAAMNLTGRWLEENYARVFPALVEHLTAKMPVSHGFSVIEDHVQTVLMRFVERDTLAPFLREGKTVKLSVLGVWAYQSASTELRRWGTDASLRVTRGAKTAREVQAGKSWRVVQSAETFNEVSPQPDDTNARPEYNNPAQPSPEDTVARQSRVDYVRQHLARIGKGHLVPAVDHVLSGGSLPPKTAKQLNAALRGIRA